MMFRKTNVDPDGANAHPSPRVPCRAPQVRRMAESRQNPARMAGCKTGSQAYGVRPQTANPPAMKCYLLW
jgi:hypothetical protein